MGLKRKMLYATILASSCLLSTTVVKADQVDANQGQNISQNVTNQPNSSENKPVNNALDQTETPDATTPKEAPTVQDSNQDQSQSNNQSNVQNNVQTTQANSQIASDKPIDGVYTVNNNGFIPLYYMDGSLETNRALAANSAWYTDTYHTLDNGNSYYRVATNEYASVHDGTFKSYVQPYSGDATVVYQAGSSIHSFKGYGNRAVYEGNDLSTGTSWKVINHANIGGKEWYQIGSDTWVPQDYVVINNGNYENAAWISGVPLIAQRPELPNGCEITAVTMMLQYAGANVDKMQMAREMPRSSDPNYGYIGQPWDGTGITIFPPALMRLVEKYAGTAKNLTGQNFDAIKYQINIGHPVVTWNTLYGFPYHALVVTGYDSNKVYYNDCWTGQTLQMGITQFINNWNTQNRRAISY